MSGDKARELDIILDQLNAQYSIAPDRVDVHYEKIRQLCRPVFDELERLRITNNSLNRRCQSAESAALQSVEDCKRQGVGLGRALANWYAQQIQRQLDSAMAEILRLTSAAGQAACVIRDQAHRASMLEREALADRVRADNAARKTAERGLMLDKISEVVRAAGWPMRLHEDEVRQVARAVQAMKETASGQQKRADKLAKDLADESLLCLDNAQAAHWLKTLVDSLEQGIKVYRAILFPCERPAGLDGTAARVAADEWTAEHARLKARGGPCNGRPHHGPFFNKQPKQCASCGLYV